MIIVCGEVDVEINKLNNMEIDSLESERLTLEEVFIYELGGLGYDIKNIIV